MNFLKEKDELYIIECDNCKKNIEISKDNFRRTGFGYRLDNGSVCSCGKSFSVVYGHSNKDKSIENSEVQKIFKDKEEKKSNTNTQKIQLIEHPLGIFLKKVSIVIWIVGLIAGIILFVIFKESSYSYNTYNDGNKVSNIFLMFLTWIPSFLSGLAFFAFGECIIILDCILYNTSN